MTIQGNVDGVDYRIDADVAQELAANGINVEAEVRQGIQNANTIVYSKHPCPFCDRAKMLLTHKGIGYTEINAVENMDEMVAKVTEATGARPQTVPQIFLHGKYIGGFNQLVEHFKNNP